MKRSHYIIRGLALAISMPSCLQAQTTQPKDTTMTRTVVVEQEYNPDIMDASKVNVLPKVEEPTVSKKEVEYATTFFPATSVPAGRDWCAHTFRTILRKSLDVHTCVESNVRKQKCCGFGTLTSTSVPSDLDVLFHILHSISHKYSKKHNNYTILIKNVKGVGGFSWQITIFLE